MNNAQEVIAAQESVKEATARVAEITGHLTREEDRLGAAHTAEEGLEALRATRAKLKGSVAMGDKSLSKELTATEAEIGKLEKIVADHASTVEGLNAHQHDATEAERLAKEHHAAVLEKHIRAEAEVVGAEYADLAERLVDSFRRLSGLAALHRMHRHGTDLIGDGSECQRLSLPSFELESIHGHQNNNPSWPLLPVMEPLKIYHSICGFGVPTMADIDQAAAAERFMGQGIAL
jgi:hypothetical protein